MKRFAWFTLRSSAAVCGVLTLQACQVSGRGGGEPAPANAQAIIDTSSASASGGAQSERHLLLVVDHDGAGFHVRQAQVVAMALPSTRFPKAQRWRADVEDGAGKAVFSANLPAGGERRGEFAGADGAMQAVHFRSDEFSFVLRVPLLEQAARIRFWETSPTVAPAAAATASKLAGDVELGTTPYPTDVK